MANLNDLKPIQNLKPFTRFCCSIGAIPTSYLISLTYEEQLIWLCDYLKNTVIPTVNNNGEAVTELQELYTTLKNYVDNYFNNLNIQTEINNKLDQMATDGTLANIINEELLDNINGKLTTLETTVANNTTNINTLTNTVNNHTQNLTTLNNQKMNYYRTKYNSLLTEFNYPERMKTPFFQQLSLFNNGKKYTTDFNVSNLKNNSANTLYISPTGSDTNSGTSPQEPLKSIVKGYQLATAGDTLILLPGIYRDQNINNNTLYVSFKKSLNIIGQGLVILTNSDNMEWHTTPSYANVYYAQTQQDQTIYEVIDFSNIQNRSTLQLKEVSSIAECSYYNNSFYFSPSELRVYIHCANNVVPNNNFIACSKMLNTGIRNNQPYPIFAFDSFTTENSVIYLENLNLIDGYGGNVLATNNNLNRIYLYAKNCNFFNSWYFEEKDAVSLRGAVNGIFQNCWACYSGKDGFNYHASYDGTHVSNGIEINCVGAYNGLTHPSSSNNCNGSTIHDGGICVRIDGIYHDNRGPNLADTANNTLSINVNCVCYDSRSTNREDTSSADFEIGNGSAIGYCYNCYFKNSTSKYNLSTINGGTININNTEYDTKRGNIINV